MSGKRSKQRFGFAVVAVMVGSVIFSGGVAADHKEGSGGHDLGAADIIQNDDVIVEGSLCASDINACADGESFGIPGVGLPTVIKLKDSVPLLFFEDTTNLDWTMGHPPSSDNFALFNNSGTRILSVEQVGEVGINIPAPTAPLHVQGNGSLAGVETVFRLDSVVPPQQIFRNSNTGDEWFFAMTADNQFKISKNGTGVVEAKFFDTGNLQIAGTLIQASDVNAKTEFIPIDNDEILQAIADLEITEWSYLDDNGVRHIGPTAQDFAAAFGLGDTTTGIAAIDADGVALAAIQALEAKNESLRAELDALAAPSDSGGPSVTSMVALLLAAVAVAMAGRNGVSRRRAGLTPAF